MAKKFKKSLFGYKIAAVNSEFEHINLGFEEEYRVLLEELKRNEKERDSIKAKIEEVNMAVASIKSVEPEIGKMLSKAHLDTSFEIYNSIKKLKFIEKERTQAINEYMKKCKELEEQIANMVSDVQSIASM